MRFSLAALGLSCAAASAFKDVTKDFDSIFKPETDQIVKAGSTVDIAWSINNTDLYGGVKVDILVYAGKDPKSLVLKDTVASKFKSTRDWSRPEGTHANCFSLCKAKVDNSDLKYKWKVDSALGTEKTYGIRIQLSSDETVYQWSNHFTVKNEGGSGGGSGSSSSSTASESSTTSGTESATSSTKSTTSAATTSASTSTSKSEHATTTASSSASATSATTPTTSSTSTAVSTVTQSPTPSQAAAAGLTARAGVAGIIVGCVAVLAL